MRTDQRKLLPANVVDDDCFAATNIISNGGVFVVFIMQPYPRPQIYLPVFSIEACLEKTSK
jgi:hypothetical protein